jgi:hypothetical protein
VRGGARVAGVDGRRGRVAQDDGVRGRLVETDGTDTHTSSYEVTSDGDGECGLRVTRADGTVVQATVTIRGRGDGARLRCEQLQVAFDWVPAPT